MRRLQDVLDRDNYLSLIRAFGGTRIWVPKTGNPGRRDRRYYRSRDGKIRKLRRFGATIAEIARLFDLSEKRVYGIVAGRVNPSKKCRATRTVKNSHERHR